jgi:hypothetical protein
MGHLDPSQGPPQLGVSCFDYKCLENKNGEEESTIAKSKQQERRQMSDKGSHGRSGRAPRTVREDAIIHFTEPVTFRFFGSSPTGRSAPEAGRSALGLGWCLLFHRTVRSVDLCFCIGSVRGSS